MRISIRKLLAAVSLTAFMLVMTACSKYKQYEHLPADIIGVWCDEDGPGYTEYLGEDGNDYSYYSAYEFTSDGHLVYHSVYPYTFGAQYDMVEYSISDNLLNVDGAFCRIDIKDDILTMTSDTGTSTYRRMDIPEICEYVLQVQEPSLQVQKEEYIQSCWDEINATETSAAEETSAEDTAAETSAE